MAKAKEMDLLTYLKNYEPNELVHFSGSTYCTRSHDSLKISNGKWCWFSHGIGGRSALDYLIKVEGLSFVEAVEHIMGQSAIQPPIFTSVPKQETPKTLLLPPRSRGTDRAAQYLLWHGIDREIIDWCIRSGCIYESEPYHNVVFVGMDKVGKARYAAMRGVESDFKGEATGSDKRFSFWIPAADSDILHVFESAIDLLSYATLRKLNGMDWRKRIMLGVKLFAEDVVQQIKSHLPAELGAMKCRVTEQHKNNGVVMTGILFRLPERSVSPLIYMEPHYEKLQRGYSMEHVLDGISGEVQSALEVKEMGLDFTDYNSVKNRLMVVLINTESNRRELKNLPHRTIEDLFVICRVEISLSGIL